jgi:hypothetical protein
VPIGCNLVCPEGVVSDSIDIQSHSGNYTLNMAFEETFKMCTKVINDPASPSGKVTMLYFFSEGGTGGFYREPNSAHFEVVDRLEGTITPESDDYIWRGSPFPYPDPDAGISSFSGFMYFSAFINPTGEEFGNDFFWMDTETSSGGANYTVVNPEMVDKNGCYTGQY